MRGSGMSDTKHTPGEWVVEEDFGGWIRAVTIPEDGGDIICSAPSDSPASNERWPANRERIVLCCNCHDDLVAAERESLNLGDHILDKFNWSDFLHLKKGVEKKKKSFKV